MDIIDRIAAYDSSNGGHCDAAQGSAYDLLDDAKDEIKRLRAGLSVIIDAGAVHGGAWCVAQARGYLEDLDFDSYPETGKPPR